ncbi:MAG: hypothetical protein KGL39_53350 [Patescibacteria group bacterium]|nr:hypothetical protein [Patescibacteria group bacterium]
MARSGATKVRIEITGETPLLMHNGRLSNPLDPHARQMKAISGKRKKTDDDLQLLSDMEFEGGLYWDDEIGVYMPTINVEMTMVEGARRSKEGKNVERGAIAIGEKVPLVYSGPRDLKGLTADPNYRLTVPARVGQSRVPRTRPIFRSWSLSVDLLVDESNLNPSDMQRIADRAGSDVGLGDWRPRYGRFSAAVTIL